MSRYGLETSDSVETKYNSMAAHYWRDKLHQIANGLSPDEEMPSKKQGTIQQDKTVEGDWTLVDNSQIYNFAA